MSSTTILCQIRRAENPFYIDAVDLCVYSIEELCYFIDSNLALVDDDFFDESLTNWLEEELGLRTLAEILTENREQEGSGLRACVEAVNAEISWIYAPDRAAFEKELDEMQNLPVPERQRRRADALVHYKKYARAIDTYRAVLENPESGPDEDTFAGVVWHNMGVTYARLFQMDEAAGCLKKAYSLLHSSRALKDYLYAVWIDSGEDAFRQRCAELGVDAGTREEMDEAIRDLPAAKRPENVDRALNGWVREYHRETGL